MRASASTTGTGGARCWSRSFEPSGGEPGLLARWPRRAARALPGIRSDSRPPRPTHRAPALATPRPHRWPYPRRYRFFPDPTAGQHADAQAFVAREVAQKPSLQLSARWRPQCLAHHQHLHGAHHGYRCGRVAHFAGRQIVQRGFCAVQACVVVAQLAKPRRHAFPVCMRLGPRRVLHQIAAAEAHMRIQALALHVRPYWVCRLKLSPPTAALQAFLTKLLRETTRPTGAAPPQTGPMARLKTMPWTLDVGRGRRFQLAA